MDQLKLGIVGRSRKENELRLPVHPLHLSRIDPRLLSGIWLERGYGERFGVPDAQLEPLVGGLLSRRELVESSDVIVLPKPHADDLEEMRDGQTLWGWPHCVQDELLTQVAIDRRLTLIAWEAMNRWNPDGSFSHVFVKNNEIAGYASVLHAMALMGSTSQYGRPLRAAVISLGATGRGAVAALEALGVRDITVLTHRDVREVPSPTPSVRLVHYERADDEPSRPVAIMDGRSAPVAEVLAGHDVTVNCVLQDTDAPLMFVADDELKLFPSGALLIDVSCDEGMGFSWARPTSFEEPMFAVGDVNYYAVDHSPSYLWNSATWEISDALTPYLPVVMAGPDAWDEDETIRRAIEIRDGVIQNPKILSFQGRTAEYPHRKS